MIKEGDKVRLKSGEIASIDEVMEEGIMYIGGIFRDDGISVEYIPHEDIKSVFVETEHPITAA
jgi:hypothetical protein